MDLRPQEAAAGDGQRMLVEALSNALYSEMHLRAEGSLEFATNLVYELREDGEAQHCLGDEDGSGKD
jgi:hypothetical protein